MKHHLRSYEYDGSGKYTDCGYDFSYDASYDYWYDHYIIISLDQYKRSFILIDLIKINKG